MLQATGMPSVLVEIGFISNKSEEEYLNSEKGQNEIVKNILDAFELTNISLMKKRPLPTNSSLLLLKIFS